MFSLCYRKKCVWRDEAPPPPPAPPLRGHIQATLKQYFKYLKEFFVGSLKFAKRC